MKITHAFRSAFSPALPCRADLVGTGRTYQVQPWGQDVPEDLLVSTLGIDPRLVAEAKARMRL